VSFAVDTGEGVLEGACEEHAAAAPSATPAPSESNDTLSVIALVVGALGLLAGVAAFASTRRPARV